MDALRHRIAGMVVVSALLMPAGCGSSTGPIAIAEAQLLDGTLEVMVSACGTEPRVAELKEGPERVEVRVETTQPRDMTECLDAVEVPLRVPLGDRTLIDAVTGEPVLIRRP